MSSRIQELVMSWRWNGFPGWISVLQKLETNTNLKSCEMRMLSTMYVSRMSPVCRAFVESLGRRHACHMVNIVDGVVLESVFL